MNDTASKVAPAIDVANDIKANYVTQVERRALYFGAAHEPLFGWLHTPRNKEWGKLGMVICPPLGVDYDHTYPVLRHLANRLAYHGIPTLRFDYSGTGNSSGFDVEPDRVNKWLNNIQEARTALTNIAGCMEVGLFGIRAGGLLAAKVAHETVLPCLILWGSVTRGRVYMREMRALHLTASSQVKAISNKSNIEAGGFIFTPQTESDIAALSLDSVLPRTNHIFFAAREGFSSDQTPPKSWPHVEHRILPGFSGMLTPPHDSHFRTPFSALDSLDMWMSDTAQQINDSIAKPKDELPCNFETTAKFRASPDDNRQEIHESILYFGNNLSRFSIITEPHSKTESTNTWVIISSSGADHTGGQVRFSVSLSRSIAKNGLSSARFDFPGVGDSGTIFPDQENKAYQTHNSDEIASLIETLQNKYGARRFILLGLCAGAYESFHGGLKLKHLPIVECVLLNPLIFYWKEGMNIDEESELPTSKKESVEQQNRWKYYLGQMREIKRWKNLLTGKSKLKPLFDTISYKAKNSLSEYLQSWTGRSLKFDNDPLTHDIRKLVESGRRLTFVFARADHGYGLLMTHAGAVVRLYIRKKVLKIWFIDRSNHSFTSRESRSQLIDSVASHLTKTYGSNK